MSDSVRVLAFLALGPAARLPRRWAFGAADAIGSLYALSPMGARVRKSMQRAFPARDASKLAWEWMARPFRDYVAMARLVAKREVADQWLAESRAPPAILREPGQSFIVATGHFSREPMACLYAASIIPKKLAALVAGLDRRSLKPRALRLRLQFGLMIEAIKAIRHGDAEVLAVGAPGALPRLVKLLKQPDVAVVISSDAVSAKGRETGLHRPFAGHALVDFALGTARLSRLSQRPIVVCVPFLDETGGTILEWSEPIPAPGRDDDGADARVTGAILDILERAVGRRPGQYVLSIGEQRRWSEAAHCWLDLPGNSASLADDAVETAPAGAASAQPSPALLAKTQDR